MMYDPSESPEIPLALREEFMKIAEEMRKRTLVYYEEPVNPEVGQLNVASCTAGGWSGSDAYIDGVPRLYICTAVSSVSATWQLVGDQT